jgi:hypothetical protein
LEVKRVTGELVLKTYLLALEHKCPMIDTGNSTYRSEKRIARFGSAPLSEYLHGSREAIAICVY